MWYNHETETWLPGRVAEGGSGKITVELEETYGENASAGMARTPPSAQPSPALMRA